jgi:hypothetical protein
VLERTKSWRKEHPRPSPARRRAKPSVTPLQNAPTAKHHQRNGQHELGHGTSATPDITLDCRP